jgi:hypothetical protein
MQRTCYSLPVYTFLHLTGGIATGLGQDILVEEHDVLSWFHMKGDVYMATSLRECGFVKALDFTPEGLRSRLELSANLSEEEAR